MEFVHTLPEPELAKIGEIILNWGGVDHLVTQLLVARYKLDSNHEARKDLLAPIDFRKKINLLSDASKKGALIEGAAPLVKLLAKATEDWVSDRNHLAHGFSWTELSGVSGVASSRNRETVTANDINKLLKRSKYVSDLALRLTLLYSHGHDLAPEALPERPA